MENPHTESWLLYAGQLVIRLSPGGEDKELQHKREREGGRERDKYVLVLWVCLRLFKSTAAQAYCILSYLIRLILLKPDIV